jgi:hypothetical protein
MYDLQGLVRSHKNIVLASLLQLLLFICLNISVDLYWCHDGKHIVPVIVQVWDCLSSPTRTTLGPNRVSVMDPWERPILVSQVVVSRWAKELCSSRIRVVLVEAVDVGVPLCRV